MICKKFWQELPAFWVRLRGVRKIARMVAQHAIQPSHHGQDVEFGPTGRLRSGNAAAVWTILREKKQQTIAKAVLEDRIPMDVSITCLGSQWAASAGG